MKLTDDILNKYLDNELSTDEIKELNKLLEEDPDALKTLKTHKFIDRILHKIETLPAPIDITNRIMGQILTVSKVKTKKFYFFRFILIIFGILFFSTIVYILSNINFGKQESNTASEIAENTSKFITENGQALVNILNSNTILIVGGFLTFILILTGYFLFESHKVFKNRLENSFK
jgi:hypothetical protein